MCDTACAHLQKAKKNRPGIGSVHGGLYSFHRHSGDLGNIYADKYGSALINIVVFGLTIDDIIDRTLIIHQDKDDLGLINTKESRTTGTSGKRIACGVIVEDQYNVDTFELPNPLEDTFGTEYTVDDIKNTIYTTFTDMMELTKSTISTKNGNGNIYDFSNPSHNDTSFKLNQLIKEFINSSDNTKKLGEIDCFQIVPFIKQNESSYTLSEKIHYLKLAEKHQIPATFLYIFYTLLFYDHLKINDTNIEGYEIEGYDVIGYSSAVKKDIEETIPFLIDILKLFIDKKWNDFQYVLVHFINAGPLLVGEFLRVPIPIKWITK